MVTNIIIVGENVVSQHEQKLQYMYVSSTTFFEKLHSIKGRKVIDIMDKSM